MMFDLRCLIEASSAGGAAAPARVFAAAFLIKIIKTEGVPAETFFCQAVHP